MTMQKINNTRIFVNEVKNSIWEKPLRGSQTQDIHYSEDKTRYKVVTLTRTPPNQVSYLKGSSMESFTLGPTPKIDFSLSAATAHTTTASERLTQLNNLSI
jgi:hypothetical protein